MCARTFAPQCGLKSPLLTLNEKKNIHQQEYGM